MVDLIGPAATPALNSWMEMLSEAGTLALPEKSNLTQVELPDGITIPDDAKARAIMLAALFRRGLL